MRLVTKKIYTRNNIFNYFDTFTPIAEISSIRVLIALTLISKLFIHQIDNTFIFNSKL